MSTTYTPQPGTLAHRIVEHLRAQPPGTTMTSVQLADALDVDDSTYIISSLVAAVKYGVVHKDWQAGNKRVLLWSLGDVVPLIKPPQDVEEDDLKPLHPVPEIPRAAASIWPGLATPAPDTRPAKITGAEKAWASGAQKNHRGSTPEWGKRRGLPPMETMTKTETSNVTKKSKPTASAPEYADIDTMVITDDPITKQANTGGDKYSPLFDKMKVGQAVKCHPKDAPKVAGAMRKWVKDHLPGAMVRAVRRYPKDNMGRVWLLAPAKGK